MSFWRGTPHSENYTACSLLFCHWRCHLASFPNPRPGLENAIGFCCTAWKIYLRKVFLTPFVTPSLWNKVPSKKILPFGEKLEHLYLSLLKTNEQWALQVMKVLKADLWSSHLISENNCSMLEQLEQEHSTCFWSGNEHEIKKVLNRIDRRMIFLLHRKNVERGIKPKKILDSQIKI